MTLPPNGGSVSTNKLLAMKVLNHACGQECVDWAIGELERGSSQREVLILAGMSPPFNHFELASLRDQAFDALGIAPVSREQAIHSYAIETACGALDGRIELGHALRSLSELWMSMDDPSEFRDFYLLGNAWDSLLISNEQWYWDGTRDNIAELTREAMQKLLEDVE